MTATVTVVTAATVIAMLRPFTVGGGSGAVLETVGGVVSLIGGAALYSVEPSEALSSPLNG